MVELNRGYEATQPFDVDDVPRFGQLMETTRTAFASELRKYFELSTAYLTERNIETPVIEKYADNNLSNSENFETFVNNMMSYADKSDRFPMVLISTSTAREKVLGIGSNFVDQVQYAPRVEGTGVGPFALTDGWYLEIETTPYGKTANKVTSTYIMASVLFSDIANATISDIVRAFNAQALYATASETSGGCLRLSAGGACAPTTPNIITVTAGTPALLVALGLTVGQTDTYLNAVRPPMNRYGMAAEISVNIDVFADSVNERQELSDLVQTFFTFYLERRRYQLIGRSYLEEGLSPEEWFHIIFSRDFAWNGQTEIPRLGGELYDMMYAYRGSIGVTTIDYINRPLTALPVWEDPDRINRSELLPVGDYFSRNWLRNL